MPSLPEMVMLSDLQDAGLDAGLVSEFKFSPKRKWRADFAYPAQKLLIEVEGGKWLVGRHQRPAGFEKDCEKYNAAALLGFRVLRFTTDMISNRLAVPIIRAALEGSES